MKLKGFYALGVSPEVAWVALSDPELLAACIPGCKGVLPVSDRELRAAATVKVGRIKARLEGSIVRSDADPPRGCTLSAEAHGVAGTVKGKIQLRLAPTDEGTMISYEGRASIGGRLAQVAPHQLDEAARVLASEFFGKFAAYLAGAVTPAQTFPSPAREHGALVPEAHGGQSTAPGDGMAPQIWIAGLVAVVIILLLVFGMVL